MDRADDRDVDELTFADEVGPHHRDLGSILARAGRPLAAAEHLQRYLRGEPDADDASMVRESMDALANQGARLN